MKDFKKFDLNENPPTVATDNTLPIGILIKHVKDFYVFGERITTETLKQYQEAIVEAMQEYSSTQRLQARNEAIQECIDLAEKLRIESHPAPDDDYKAGYRKAITNFKAELQEKKLTP